jgi:phage antirepressor YoqD-like protein
MKTEIFKYKENPITFMNGEDTMVNATEMAKPFGKIPNNWLQLPSTRSFLDTLTNSRKSTIADYQPVATSRGGLNPGTWMHEDVALEFARWLSPEFAIWCNDRIKELLTKGITALGNDEEIMARAILLAKEKIDRLEIENESLAEYNHHLTQKNDAMTDFIEHLVNQGKAFDMKATARLLNIGRNKLMIRMREMGIFTKENGYNEPYQKFIDSGYFIVKINPENGYAHTFATLKGVAWLRERKKITGRLFEDNRLPLHINNKMSLRKNGGL